MKGEPKPEGARPISPPPPPKKKNLTEALTAIAKAIAISSIQADRIKLTKPKE